MAIGCGAGARTRARSVAGAALLQLAALGAPGLAAGAIPPLQPPPPEALAEARAIVEAMKKGERGPFRQLRWYCNDGTVHPPQPYPCKERGGGHQHAEHSPERQRLAELGWSVGTLFTGLSFGEIWDGERRNQRLRELALERFLVDVDDGWVMRRARFYRGSSQVEDEEHFGRLLLLELLARTGWVEGNFLLARESVRTIPHHSGSDRTRAVRRLAQDLAERDRSFEKVRVAIHSSPGPAGLTLTRQWLVQARERGVDPANLATAEQLVEALLGLHGREGRAERIERHRRTLGRGGADAELDALLDMPSTELASERIGRLAAALGIIRERVVASRDPARSLALLDVSVDLEAGMLDASFEVAHDRAATRSDLLAVAGKLLEASFGTGLLSARERDALAVPVAMLASRREAPTAEYLKVTRGLERASRWAQLAVTFTYAEALARYGALEPRARTFPDDLMRGSPILPVTTIASQLTRDAEQLSGLPHVIFGEQVAGVAGLNPGVALGRLRVLSESDLDAGVPLGPHDVVVLPRTVPELTPVAGIISLGEDNLLSHVQILARNLGIPNATLSPLFASVLAPHDGREVLLAVDSSGSVVLERLESLPAPVRTDLLRPQERDNETPKVDAPVPDLEVRSPLSLSTIRRDMSGRLVGPKAANLGELAHLFPQWVPPGVALPFGIYAAHADGAPGTPKQRLDAAFGRFRGGELDEAGLLAEVESVESAVRALRLLPATRAELLPMLERHFGPPGSYGVFVRSDTNVEDLPLFTGAGLNRTVPHVVGLERQIAAISEVWASPFAPRAMAWRRRVLRRPEEVYPSVLLMVSVPSDKSGVLVTTDLTGGGQGITVATAWGVGGAVDGEAAETLLLGEDGSTTLVNDAKAPYRRRLRPEGGVDWVPAEIGAVLTPGEREQLRELAAEVRGCLEPEVGAEGQALPWDVEFGFKSGGLVLFQARPLVERGQASADRVFDSLALSPLSLAATVRLDARPGEKAGVTTPATPGTDTSIHASP